MSSAYASCTEEVLSDDVFSVSRSEGEEREKVTVALCLAFQVSWTRLLGAGESGEERS